MRTARAGGFTLVELLTALLILSLLALMSYRGLGAVLDARDHVKLETEKWRQMTSFLARFESDLRHAAPRPVRTIEGNAPAWLGQPVGTAQARLEFSRFATDEGSDSARRLAYRLNEKQEIELWLWPGLDVPAASQPARYPVLTGVARFELQYLNPELSWVDAWPTPKSDASLPLAVRLRVVLVSNEEIVRVFALKS